MSQKGKKCTEHVYVCVQVQKCFCSVAFWGRLNDYRHQRGVWSPLSLSFCDVLSLSLSSKARPSSPPLPGPHHTHFPHILTHTEASGGGGVNLLLVTAFSRCAVVTIFFFYCSLPRDLNIKGRRGE